MNRHIHTGTQTPEVNKTEDFFQDLKNTFNLEFIHYISENQINVRLLKRLVQCACQPQRRVTHTGLLSTAIPCAHSWPITYPQL